MRTAFLFCFLFTSSICGLDCVSAAMLQSRQAQSETPKASIAGLQAAIKSNNAGQIKSIIAANPKLLTATISQSKLSPLHFAIQSKRFEAAKQLLALGASTTAVDSRKQSPLHTAISQGSREMAKLLIENSSNVNLTDQNGTTPLMRLVMQLSLIHI